MKKQAVKNLAKELLHTSGLSNIQFEFLTHTNTVGQCRFNDGKAYKIEFSWPMSKHLSERDVKENLLQEIAHALSGENNRFNATYYNTLLTLREKVG